jgi:hypothetical protein
MLNNKDPSLLIFLLFFIVYYINSNAKDIENVNTVTVPVVEPDNKPEPSPSIIINWVEIPIYRKINEKSIYSEILSRSKDKPYGNKYGRDNNVHETLHGVHAELRNQYFIDHKVRLFFLYYDKGLALSLKTPNTTMQNVIPYVPSSLKGKRYNLYFNQQIQHWNHQPLYILDEWVCYIFGGKTAIQDYKNNILYKEKTDSVSGCLEFSIYAVAMYNSIKKNNPEYFIEQPNFKLIIHEYLIKAEKTFLEGRNIFPSDNQEYLINNLMYCEGSEEIRKTLINDFGSVFLLPVAE